MLGGEGGGRSGPAGTKEVLVLCDTSACMVRCRVTRRRDCVAAKSLHSGRLCCGLFVSHVQKKNCNDQGCAPWLERIAAKFEGAGSVRPLPPPPRSLAAPSAVT